MWFLLASQTGLHSWIAAPPVSLDRGEKRADAMPSQLFVYGTLMAAALGAAMGGPQRDRLGRESRNLGAATIAGRLYDFGRYPGLVACGDASERVHGEIVQLADPAASFAWLDAYEDIVPGRVGNMYERVQVAATFSSGAQLDAWVYVYLGPLDDRPPIASGRWNIGPQSVG